MHALFGVPSTWLKNAMAKSAMRRMTRRFYSAVQALHPWLPLTDMPGMLRESRRLLDRHPQGGERPL